MTDAQEPNFLVDVVRIIVSDLKKGCRDYTRQVDTGTGKELDLCMFNQVRCPFYDGGYRTQGETNPVGNISQYDCGIATGVEVGFCRLQKDAIKIGPISIFDKRWIRPTPQDR